MKIRFLIFLGIFIIMIIPKNVFALTGSYDLNTSNKLYTRVGIVGDDTDYQVTSDESGFMITNSGSRFYNNYQYEYRTRINILNDTFDIFNARLFNSNSMGMCSSSCDLDVTFDYWLTYLYTSEKINQAKFVLNETYNSISIFGLDINDELKRFWCRVEPIEIETHGNEPYYHMQATCNTSNFKTISYIELPGGNPLISNSDNFYVTISYFFNTLNYETKTYTGTQDGNGLENIPTPEGGVIDTLDTINDNITDDSIDTNTQNSTLNNLNSQLASNNVISDLLLLPVTLYQKILNTLNSNSCTPFSLGTLYNTELVLPCIQVQNYIGSTLWTTIDLIFSGMFVLAIRKKFVDIFNNMTNLKDRGNEIE